MTTEKLQFTTGVGRLVGGSLTTANDKDYHGKPRDKPQYYFALALSKSDPATTQLITDIMNKAYQDFSSIPHIQPQIQMGLAATTFAWKISDGDDPKFADRPGYPGHYVFKFTSTYPPRVCGPNNEQFDPALIQNGYYVQMAGSVSGNGKGDHTAGIFMNPLMVKFVAQGEVINSGPSASQLFGDGPPPAPPVGAAMPPPAAPMAAVPGVGAPPPPGMPTPAAPAAPGLPGVAPPPAAAAPVMPAPAAPAAPQQPAYQPHPGILIPGQSQ